LVVIVTVNDSVMKVFSNIINISKIKWNGFPEETVKKNTPDKTDNWNGGEYVQGSQLLDSVHCVPNQNSVTIIS